MGGWPPQVSALSSCPSCPLYRGVFYLQRHWPQAWPGQALLSAFFWDPSSCRPEDMGAHRVVLSPPALAPRPVVALTVSLYHLPGRILNDFPALKRHRFRMVAWPVQVVWVSLAGGWLDGRARPLPRAALVTVGTSGSLFVGQRQDCL